MGQDFTPEGHESKYCVNCGARIDKNAMICPGCGVRQPNGFNTLTGFFNTGGSPPSTEEDWNALRFIERGSIAIIIGVILGFFTRLDIPLYAFSSPFNYSGAAFGFTGFLLIFTFIPAVAFLFYANMNYRKSFSIYSKKEPQSFSLALELSKFLYAGIVLIVIGIFLIIFIVEGLAYANPFVVLLFIAPIILGAIFIILGYIGIILGLWKIGTRFNDALMQVGSILFIIPYVSIIGGILVYVSARMMRNNMTSTTGPQTAV